MAIESFPDQEIYIYSLLVLLMVPLVRLVIQNTELSATLLRSVQIDGPSQIRAEVSTNLEWGNWEGAGKNQFSHSDLVQRKQDIECNYYYCCCCRCSHWNFDWESRRNWISFVVEKVLASAALA